MSSFTLVDLESSGVSTSGKARPGVLQELIRDFERHGIDATRTCLNEALAKQPKGEGTHVALLFYNELSLVKNKRVDWLRARQEELIELGYKVIHPAEQGEIVGIKSRQNDKLTDEGILMPKRQKGEANSRVFSNAQTAAHVATYVLEPGSALNEDRYNAEFIDSAVKVDGKNYFVCIRTQAVGPDALMSWIRARPTSENDPSVHTKDTPIDHNLIRELHNRVIVPNHRALTEISQKIHDALGFGFFCHDIIPCAKTGQLYVCETNYKLYDANYKFHLRPIADKHPVPLLWKPRRIARFLARKTIAQIF